jgi:hypothetical protein
MTAYFDQIERLNPEVNAMGHLGRSKQDTKTILTGSISYVAAGLEDIVLK